MWYSSTSRAASLRTFLSLNMRHDRRAFIHIRPQSPRVIEVVMRVDQISYRLVGQQFLDFRNHRTGWGAPGCGACVCWGWMFTAAFGFTSSTMRINVLEPPVLWITMVGNFTPPKSLYSL